MRTLEQELELASFFSPTVLLERILTDDDIRELISIYDNSPNKIYKNTGPVTLDLTAEMLTHAAIRKIFAAVKDAVGEFQFMSGFFFEVTSPHIIHNDDSFMYPRTFKGMTIPLRIEREYESESYPKLCFFEQYYLGGPSKFMKGSKNVPSYYNQILYEYDGVKNLVDTPFPDEIRSELMPHIRPANFEGLSFKESYDSIPGNVLVFDAVRLHAASDFRKVGITKKLGISIFTTKPISN